MSHLPAFDTRTRSVIAQLGVYFDLEAPSPDASDQDYREYLDQLEQHTRTAKPLLSRLRNTADYVAKVHANWRQARASEIEEKIRFLEALVETAKPALPAISSPMVKQRTRIPGRDDLIEHWHARGFVALDRWRRDVDRGRAGVDVVLGEEGQWYLLDHRCMGQPGHQIQIHSQPDKATPGEVIDAMSRHEFHKAVENLVEAIYQNSRSQFRRDQIRESHNLIDTLSAIRTLLER